MKKIPLIMDCVLRNDAVPCIEMLEASEKYHLMGITAVYGETPPEDLSRWSGAVRPVYQGAAKPLLTPEPAQTDTAGRVPFAAGYAWDFIYNTAADHPGELELIAAGPLTNIAIAVLKHPDMAGLVKRLIIRGGAATVGDAAPLAEKNFYQDPHAAQIVLEAGFRDIVVVDLDCCRTALNAIAPSDGVDAYTDLAAAAAISPEIVSYRDVYMVCETTGGKTAGQSIIDRLGISGKTNVHLAEKVDSSALAALLGRCGGGLRA